MEAQERNDYHADLPGLCSGEVRLWSLFVSLLRGFQESCLPKPGYVAHFLGENDNDESTVHP